LEGVPIGVVEEETVAEACDAAVLDGDAGYPFKEDTDGPTYIPSRVTLLAPMTMFPTWSSVRMVSVVMVRVSMDSGVRVWVWGLNFNFFIVSARAGV
jgi:hypothetical protein